MPSQFHDPAARIIEALGGVDAVATALDIHKSRVFRWRIEKSARTGGTGGLIPQRHHVSILDLARTKDVPLTAADFLPVRREAARGVEPARAQA